jgi:hypothetical protein
MWEVKQQADNPGMRLAGKFLMYGVCQSNMRRMVSLFFFIRHN